MIIGRSYINIAGKYKFFFLRLLHNGRCFYVEYVGQRRIDGAFAVNDQHNREPGV